MSKQNRNRITHRARTDWVGMEKVESLERRLMLDAGDLLDSFGTDGLVTTDFDSNVDRGYDIVVRPNGRIVVVGEVTRSGSGLDFGIAQYLSTGELDNSFGTNGRIVLDLGSAVDSAYRAIFQADGRLLVGGRSGAEGVVVRYNVDGTLDTTFANSGIVRLPELAEVRGIGITSQNEILVAGHTPSGQFGVLRLDQTGQLDTTYGASGLATSTFAANVTARDMVVLADQALVIGFEAGIGIAMARFTELGEQDEDFGTDGEVITPNGRAEAVTVQDDGRIVLVGERGGDFAVFRYTPTGTLDNTFDSDGVFTLNVAGTDVAYGVFIQDDDKIVVGGSSQDGSSQSRVAVLRLNPDGTIDSDFGNSGVATTDSNTFERAQDVARAGDGHILVAGDTQNDFAVWKFQASDRGTMPPPDDQPPTATLNVSDFEPPILSHTFDVTYTDDVAVLFSSIGNGDLRVIGPNGFVAPAQLLFTSTFSNSATITATYTYDPPGGAWGIEDLGTYTIVMSPLQVRDVTGNYVPGGALGTFTVGFTQFDELVLGTTEDDKITLVQRGSVLIATVNGNARQIPITSSVAIVGLDGNDHIWVDADVDVLLHGGRGNDILIGGRGNDMLVGGEGSDRLAGGAGNDTYTFEEPVNFELDTVVERVGGGSDTLDFSAITSRLHADLSQSQIPLSHHRRHVHPGSTGMFDHFETLIGGQANDFLKGNIHDNRLLGGAGDDVIEGHEGDDRLIGGPGNDRYVFRETMSPEVDIISEMPGEGDDIIDMRLINHNIFADFATRLLVWHEGRSLRPGEYVEQVWGGRGNDYMIAGNRSMLFSGGVGNDTLIGGSGHDQLWGGPGNDLLRGNDGDDTLISGGGLDRMDGGAGDNRLIWGVAGPAIRGPQIR